MVSKASEDFPDPDTPVTTVNELLPIVKSMFLRLCTRAPRTTMLSVDICNRNRRKIGWGRSCPTLQAKVLRRGQRAYGISLLYGTRDRGSGRRFRPRNWVTSGPR